MSYPGHLLGDLTPQHRCSRCILQPQPTGQGTHWVHRLSIMHIKWQLCILAFLYKQFKIVNQHVMYQSFMSWYKLFGSALNKKKKQTNFVGEYLTLHCYKTLYPYRCTSHNILPFRLVLWYSDCILFKEKRLSWVWHLTVWGRKAPVLGILIWFLCLTAYQPSRVIQCGSPL